VCWFWAAIRHAFRRRRFALALARVTNGDSTAAWPRPVSAAVMDCCMAAAFSSPIRQYSAAEHVPCAIIIERCHTVSHAAKVKRVIINGNAREAGGLCFLIPQR